MENLSSLSDLASFYRFGLAMVIGFLIGLQREYASHREGEKDLLFGGARTFPLLGLLGCSGAWLSHYSDSIWPLLLILFVFSGLLVISYHHAAKEGNIGITTEVASLLTIIIGAMCYFGEFAFAAALGVAVTVLLALKFQTQKLAKNITREDIFATLKFAVIAIIILPVLPRTGIWESPFDVLVPYKIWLMVIFISGISFLGYILIKFFGTERAIGLTGLMGGLASSTAVTLSLSQKSREEKGLSKAFAYAILLAWSVMFVRVIIEVAAVNIQLLGKLLPAMIGGLLASLAWAGWLYYAKRSTVKGDSGNFKNPFRLGPAIIFGLIYAAVLLVSNLAQIHFGNAGVYISSIVSALVDVDAITLSLAELSRSQDEAGQVTSARAIVVAAATNTLVKGGLVMSVGAPELRNTILPGIGLIVASTLILGFLF